MIYRERIGLDFVYRFPNLQPKYFLSDDATVARCLVRDGEVQIVDYSLLRIFHVFFQIILPTETYLLAQYTSFMFTYNLIDNYFVGFIL